MESFICYNRDREIIQPMLKHGNECLQAVIIIQSKIDKEAREILKQDNTIAVLATIDKAGSPHLDIISSLQGLGDNAITLNLTGNERGKRFYRPDAAFLVLSPDMNWLRGSMHYTHFEDNGGIRTCFFDLISIDEIRKLSARMIFFGTAVSHLKARIISAGTRDNSINTSLAMFLEAKAYKFLCWEEDKNLSDIVPVVQAVPSGADRIVFSSIPHGEDFADADMGANAAIICLYPKVQSMLVKGALISKGVMQIKQIYDIERMG